MGGSRWSDDFYRDREEDRKRTGKSAFAYDEAMKAARTKVAHPKMSPLKTMRESRDSDAHPNSNAIGVVFDVTGSMGGIPVQLQKKLPQLMGLLLRKNYVQDPQILFGAVGDFRADRVPLQMGQFESGVEMDDDLGRLFLEGGGGGTYEESYELPLYYFARHTSIDCFEKRGKKGYLFLIGDEMPYTVAGKAEIEKIIGDDLPKDLTIEEVIREARTKFNVFFIIPRGASNGADPKLRARWTGLLGEQNVIMLDDPDGVCEAIGIAIGLCEGTVDADSIEDDLKDAGATTVLARTVKAALDPLAKGIVHVAKTALGTSTKTEGATERL